MGKSKSSSKTASNVTDRRIGATDQAVVVAEGSTLVATDHGATAAATHVAERSLIENGAIARAAIDGVVKAQGRALDTVDDAITESYDFSGDIADKAFSSLENVHLQSLENVATANKGILDISEEAIYRVEQSTRSDAAQSFNKLLETTAIVAAGFLFVKAVK